MALQVNLKAHKIQFDLFIEKVQLNVSFACKFQIEVKRGNQKILTQQQVDFNRVQKVAEFKEELSLQSSCYLNPQTNQYQEKSITFNILLFKDGQKKVVGKARYNLCQIINQNIENIISVPLSNCPDKKAFIQVQIKHKVVEEMGDIDRMSQMSRSPPTSVQSSNQSAFKSEQMESLEGLMENKRSQIGSHQDLGSMQDAKEQLQQSLKRKSQFSEKQQIPRFTPSLKASQSEIKPPQDQSQNKQAKSQISNNSNNNNNNHVMSSFKKKANNDSLSIGRTESIDSSSDNSKQHMQLQDEVKQYQNKLQQEKKRLIELQQQYQQQSTSLQQVQNENEEYKTKIAQFTQVQQKQKETFLRLRGEYDKLKKEGIYIIKNIKYFLAEERQDNGNNEEAILSLQSQLLAYKKTDEKQQKMDKQMKKLEAQVKQLKEENQNLTQQSQSKDKQQGTDAQFLKTQVQKLQNRLKTIENDHQQEILEQSQELEELQQKNLGLLKENTKYKNDVEDLKEKYKLIQTQTNAIKKQHKSMTEDLVKSKQQIGDLINIAFECAPTSLMDKMQQVIAQ